MNTLQSKKYAFVLGRERDLCLAELRATLSRFGFCFNDFILSDNVVLINLPATRLSSPKSGQAGLDKDPAKLIDILGGTTKIFEIVEVGVILNDVLGVKNLSSDDRILRKGAQDDKSSLRDSIKNLIIQRAEKTTGKFNFGFSAYGRHRAESLNPLGLNIKKDLKGQLSLRFIALKEKELSTIVSSKNKLATDGLEIGFFNDQIGILIAVTDPEAWSERDYGKPKGDKFSGMVPPKLARAMVNIALSTQYAVHSTQQNKRSVGLSTENCELSTPRVSLVVDPFCGSGNILMEALMLGCDVLGSDVSEKAVNDSKENVDWLEKQVASTEYRVPSHKIFQADATSIDFTRNLELGTRNCDGLVVVTEPYLGEPKKYLSSIRAVRGEYEKIKELYLDFFRNLITLRTLKTTVVLCLVFPLVETVEKIKFSLYSESVDEIRKIGYTELANPLVYGRDYQIVKREIVLLNFKNRNPNVK